MNNRFLTIIVDTVGGQVEIVVMMKIEAGWSRIMVTTIRNTMIGLMSCMTQSITRWIRRLN